MKGLVFILITVGLVTAIVKNMDDLQAKGKHPANMACNDCHLAQGKINRQNAGTLVASQEQLCKGCHPNAITASHPTGIEPRGDIPKMFPLDWKGDMTCSTCHKIHSSRPGLPRANVYGKDLCLSCHEETFFARMKDEGMSIMVSGHLDARKPLTGNIDTFSIQCMSCHDSLSDDLGVRITGNIIRHNSDRGNHPVGMLYENSISYGGYRRVAQIPREIVLPNGKVSCISCHHGYSDNHGKLVMTNNGSKLCFSCHDI